MYRRNIAINYFVLSIFISSISISFGQWKPAGNKIKSKWATEVNPANVLGEYPRPLMVRESWKNLNGLWDYAIMEKGSSVPTNFEGQVLVPFAVESSLSGVMKEVGSYKELWYKTTFDIPRGLDRTRIFYSILEL
ncbi:hypothetical protein NYZ99_06130 [Maribacter litopenaei]|uniref:Beta-galactosidase n=1 Tax=Maribacter litopenaei TaxID=2976127 RepID=A0ABY5YAS4_9FLAO|nr:hypothetical protein [Maribacter litopenaei]UWX55941.1 hypothetical protein NYZ99_06130 [Maribacter litopenaei]